MATNVALTVRKATKQFTYRKTRPFRVFYFHSLKDDEAGDWSKIVHCSSEVGSIRSANVKVVIGQYYKAVVHDEEGIVRYRIERNGNKITITGIFFDFEEYMAKLQREAKAIEKLKRAAA